MQPAIATLDADAGQNTDRGAGQSSARLSTALALLVLGLNVNVSAFANISFALWPVYLLPLFAAWWARRDGVVIAVPIALLSLVPDLGWRIGFFSVGFGYSEVACVLAVGAAIAGAPGDAAARFAAVHRPSCRLVWLMAMLVWALAAVEGARQEVHGELIGLAIDPLAALAALLVLVSVDGRRLAGALQRPSHSGVILLGAAVLVGLVVQLSLRTGVAADRKLSHF